MPFIAANPIALALKYEGRPQLSFFATYDSQSVRVQKNKTTHLEIIAVGVVGVPEEGRRRDGFIVRPLVDFFALQRNIGRR